MDISKTTECVSQIRGLQSEWDVPMSNTICDEDGVGGGVVDQLGCKGFVGGSKPINPKPTQNFQNLRSQCYFKLAEYVNANKIYLNDKPIERDKIVQELGQIKQKDIDSEESRTLVIELIALLV